MLLNTDKERKGLKSAYSIFNKDVEKLDGDIDMQDVDRQLRTGASW